MDVGNLISGSSAFSKSSLKIWKFMVHLLLKPSLEDFEPYLASVWDECNCVVVWTFFGIAFLWDWIGIGFLHLVADKSSILSALCLLIVLLCFRNFFLKSHLKAVTEIFCVPPIQYAGNAYLVFRIIFLWFSSYCLKFYLLRAHFQFFK